MATIHHRHHHAFFFLLPLHGVHALLGRIFFMYKNDEGLTTTKNFPRTISLVRRTPLMIASQVKTILLAQHNNINFLPQFPFTNDCCKRDHPKTLERSSTCNKNCSGSGPRTFLAGKYGSSEDPHNIVIGPLLEKPTAPHCDLVAEPWWSRRIRPPRVRPHGPP